MIRGRIGVARGNARAALEDAAAAIAFGTTSNNDEILYYGAALEARCRQVQADEKGSLEACDTFLSRWSETGGLSGRSMELCEIASPLAEANRHQDIRDAASRLPVASRWREALLLVADTRYADAALLYEAIGSAPLAADADVLAADQAHAEGRAADAAHHTERVFAFADRTGATVYRNQAERSTKAASA